MADRPLLCAFVKVRNEIVREGNVYRLLRQLERWADAAVLCDDASWDGTAEVLRDWVRGRQLEDPAHADRWVLVEVEPEQQDFRQELAVKQAMLAHVHRIAPRWVMWLDGDETLDARGTAAFRAWAREALERPEVAWRFHYTQLWRWSNWARTDDGFDDGWFLKLWRWTPELRFDVRPGTHHHQFPIQLLEALARGLVGQAPFEILHWGNWGRNLVWKAVEYWGGLGDVDRHLRFAGARYRPVERAQLPPEGEWVEGPVPRPWTAEEVARIEALRDLRGLAETFCVVIPTWNRAHTLSRALGSVRAQTWPRWVCLVLDDGSEDDTPALLRAWQERDPRIFYARYSQHRGGVAMNEIGMAAASEIASWWTRLGSDDWWGPRKLELDAEAFRRGARAVYGAYVVIRDGQPAEVSNPPRPPAESRRRLHHEGFVCSWANVAVATEVLREVRRRWGRFADPRLRNMEDYLVNARIAHVADWQWRGVVEGRFVLDPEPELARRIAAGELTIEGPEAVWTVAPDGASAQTWPYVEDELLTRRLIAEERG